MRTVHHRYATVGGRQLFYREAGPADGPAVVLLHGFPASSFMFRNLIPLLADRYHVAQALTLETVRWQYLHGVADETLVSPDTWEHDFALLSRPGNDLIQLRLFADYATNPPLYPKLHAYLRDSRVPVLAIWGRNDEIFLPAGALAFADDARGAEICLLDGGHFLLESHLDAAAGYIRRFLDRTLT